MKNEKLLDVIGQVKEEFIEEAAPEKEAVTKEETMQEKNVTGYGRCGCANRANR